MISKERIKQLNNKEILSNKSYVLYWMQASQRTHYNHALEYAIDAANKLNKPLLVYFGLTDNFPEANKRHYYFMLEGIKEVEENLLNRNIKMVIKHNSPEIGAIDLSKDACALITDRGYLKVERKWREIVANSVDCIAIQVESNVIVPIQIASNKEEYAAATIRNKINSKISLFALPLEEKKINNSLLNMNIDSLNIKNIDDVINNLNIDSSVTKTNFKGGTSEAYKHLTNFINNKIMYYNELKNEPANDYTSNLSPYLHFGQISPLDIFLKLKDVDSSTKESFLEELIVRRELAYNFVFYNDNYDSYECIPTWAKQTLEKHKKDIRENIYSLQDFENAKTHDPYWNAAEKELVLAGKMHGYMRMYWGKKILEWTSDPKEAYKITLYLNNKYSLDGRDPNAFTGVAWCYGKHDRPWTERNIFGNIRYMNDKGLERKFDIEKYVQKVNMYENNN